MKIYRCSERLPVVDRSGQKRADLAVELGEVFTAEDGQGEKVRLEGTQGLRLTVSRGTLERYFEELA